AGGLLSNANNSGHAEGTTQSAVSDGSVIVRNEDKQKQDVNELNRDTEHANNGSINPIFDKEKEQNRLKQAQLIGEIGNQAMDIIRTEGDIAGYKAQKDPDALAIAKKQLEAAGKTPTEQAIKDQAYNNAMAQYGTGSDFQKAAQAVTGLLQGLAGDNLAGALANASSPYLATLIKQQVGEDNKAANAMAHAVLGAVVAELNNQSAAAGGLGAGGGELSAHVILNTLFPGKKVSDLTESEKQQVSALSQLASGLAGGLTTGDIAGAITGSQAGKNAVENNFLHSEQIMSFVDAQAKTKTPEERKQLQKDIDTLDKQLQSQAERWGISTNDMKSALDSLKTLEDLPDCNAQCQDMVKDSISKLEQALENRIAKHSSQTENLKELTGILATVIVLNESGLIDGRSTTSGGGKGISSVTGSSKIDNAVQGGGQKGKETNPIINQPNITVISPEIETKILAGQRVGNSNKLIGGHSSSVSNENPNYAVETIKLNPDGTRVVKFTTQFPDGNLSKIKTSTLFPENWSDKSIIDSFNKIGNSSAIGQRSSTGETLHRGVINGVEIDVIKKGNQVTAGYPVGGKPTPGFNPID
ncbi:VENN motif pre-toxin domain-containing protein, partial [Proteus mirabilis]|uniref:VENN motif pre-toxin domain-containing protein n=1 Tax=Proteus mirabilis TaxID=584 RepID=UPI00391C7054